MDNRRPKPGVGRDGPFPPRPFCFAPAPSAVVRRMFCIASGAQDISATRPAEPTAWPEQWS